MGKLNGKSLSRLWIVLAVALLVAGTSGVALAQHEANQAVEAAHDQVAGHDAAHEEAAVGMAGEGHGEADVEGHAAGEHGAEAHEAGPPHLPNLLTVISPLVPESVAAFLEHYENPIFSMFVALLVAIFFIWLAGRLSVRNPGRTQMLVELFFGWLYDLFKAVLGDEARRYTPYLGTLFIFILANNLFGMVPLGHSATSSFATTTFALGMLTFFYVQGIALKKNGFLGYLHHMAGSPTCGLEWGFSVLLFPLHLLGELIKPISLSLRLFGNIFGEDALVATMVMLGTAIIYNLTSSSFVPGLPLQFPFYFLGLLSSTIQALVFTLLSTVYIALWLPHGDHEGHGEAHGH